MTINEALKWGAKKIKSDSAFLDADILLSYTIKKPKEFLFAHPDKKITKTQLTKYKSFINRRAKHEPIAYITGHKEFYGYDFLVSPDVLIPRPETETLIEQIKNPKNIIDIGLGSGVIAITLKKLFPKARVYGTEISPRAIVLARKNAKKLKTNIILKKGNLLSPFKKLPDNIIITANLPYLSQKEWQSLKPNVKHYEPKSALIGGKIGIEIYEKLFRQIKKLNPKNATLIIEIGARQKPAIEKLAMKIFQPKKIECHRDLSGKRRIIKITLTKS